MTQETVNSTSKIQLRNCLEEFSSLVKLGLIIKERLFDVSLIDKSKNYNLEIYLNKYILEINIT